MNRTLNVYSLRDSKAGIYHVPQYFNTHGEAERWLTDMVKFSPDSPVARHPEDFDLLHLGTFEQSTGLVKGLQTATHIAKALHLAPDTKE